jgi:hypothetical protein
MARKRQGRAARRRPYAQGQLDALCGVYAAVNAIQTLVPRLTQDEAERLFQALMTALRAEDTGRIPLVAGGLSADRLRRTILNADQYVRRRLGGRLVVRRVPRGVADRWSLATLWGLLSQKFAEGYVAILGIDGIHNHWTLAAAVTPKTIRLSDSDGLRVLKRKNCRSYWISEAYHTIDPNFVIFLKWHADGSSG